MSCRCGFHVTHRVPAAPLIQGLGNEVDIDALTANVGRNWEAEGHSNSCEQCSVDAVTTRCLRSTTMSIHIAYSLHDTKIRPCVWRRRPPCKELL